MADMGALAVLITILVGVANAEVQPPRFCTVFFFSENGFLFVKIVFFVEVRFI